MWLSAAHIVRVVSCLVSSPSSPCSVTFKPSCLKSFPSILMLCWHLGFQQHVSSFRSTASMWWHAMPTGTQRWPTPGRPPARSALTFSSSTAAPTSASSSWPLQTCPGRTITGTTAAGGCPPSSEELARAFADLDYIAASHSSIPITALLCESGNSPFPFSLRCIPVPSGNGASGEREGMIRSKRGCRGSSCLSDSSRAVETSGREHVGLAGHAARGTGTMGERSSPGLGTQAPPDRAGKGRRERRARREGRRDGDFP